MTFGEMQSMIGAWAKRKGWEFNEKEIPEKIALMHSELSEALEQYRDGFGPSHVYYVDKKPEGIPVELADTVIRIMQFCSNFGINLERIIEEKMTYNETRPYRHGGKVV